MNWFTERKLVVAPVDFSEKSEEAARETAQLIGDVSRLHIVHVLAPVIASGQGMAWEQVLDHKRCGPIKEGLEKRFEDLLEKGAHFAVMIGDPGSEIVEYANDQGAELIVLPSHGRTGMKRILIGSVAERVCRLANCPVLVLRD